MNLSPLNFRNLVDRAREQNTYPPEAKTKRRAVQVWMCSECSDVHDWEDDAEECCAPSKHPEDAPTDCPVCGKEGYSMRDAADCCLWKDMDAATRHAAADRVEAGASWAEVLGINAALVSGHNTTLSFSAARARKP